VEYTPVAKTHQLPIAFALRKRKQFGGVIRHSLSPGSLPPPSHPSALVAGDPKRHAIIEVEIGGASR
jgi:hypothetical protein